MHFDPVTESAMRRPEVLSFCRTAVARRLVSLATKTNAVCVTCEDRHLRKTSKDDREPEAPTRMSLSTKQRDELLKVVKQRFDKHMGRHQEIEWTSVRKRFDARPDLLWSLHQMEVSGGEPDVVGHAQPTGEYIFYDCSTESPSGRRSLCYDHEALDARKEAKPKDSTVGLAKAMGIELLTEEKYLELQSYGTFDTKTSSWLRTPSEVRKLGGAIFGDRRYDRVFVYHNGAQSYYAARGFRGWLSI